MNVDSYSDSKSMSQLLKDRIKRRKELSHVLCEYLQLNDPDVCQNIPLLKYTDQSIIITPNDGNCSTTTRVLNSKNWRIGYFFVWSK